MDFLDWISEKFSSIYNGILDLLPESPIVWLSSNSKAQMYLSYVNWFVPVYLFISILETWIVAVAMYYAVQVVLRWLKVVE